MSSFIIVGKRLLPREQIALVESYAPSETTTLQTTRTFQSRVIMINRDSVLLEEAPELFAQASGFRMLDGDRVAFNPVVRFNVETFAPVSGFTPTKPYVTRLRWRDLDGNDQSKLLVTSPDAVLSAVMGDGPAARLPPGRGNGTRPRRARQTSRLKPSLTQS
ncbi:hypothetical protein HNR60_003297 [Rhodopseudomonas rhenobacensis]|uniref:Uncharacterized protein n=1 Tax=Rhodopseudomonas rhenobacensis TaxID=87461 RepID=A0A7W8E041_9BRAD|nr:hypothetical protein [Rhodopseudomonas rhenobacensis]MBB5048530.1 hypothetical protein [Rhodopseudomonas rhenobacensis]